MTLLKKLAVEKHSSLLSWSITNGRERFSNIGSYRLSCLSYFPVYSWTGL